MAAALFSDLKKRGFNAELVTEYAKDKVWEHNDTLRFVGYHLYYH